jgi:Arc/MetJ-type ribon-helix-helix transcriptional regulator
MPKRKDMKFWNIPVTPHLDDVLEEAVQRNAHVSKSDFVRSAVREKLKAIGLGSKLDLVEEVKATA